MNFEYLKNNNDYEKLYELCNNAENLVFDLPNLSIASARKAIEYLLSVIEQITYLMFIKILDDNEIKKEKNAVFFEEEVVNPIFDKEHQNCRCTFSSIMNQTQCLKICMKKYSYLLKRD